MPRIYILLLILPLLSAKGYAQSSPEAVVDAFHEALVQGDSARVAQLLLPEAVILESGHRETRGEYTSHHMQGDMRFLRAMKRTIVQRDSDQTSEMAWVATISRLEGTYRDRALSLQSAELMVLRKVGNTWRIAAIHWSSRKN